MRKKLARKDKVLEAMDRAWSYRNRPTALPMSEMVLFSSSPVMAISKLSSSGLIRSSKALLVKWVLMKLDRAGLLASWISS